MKAIYVSSPHPISRTDAPVRHPVTDVMSSPAISVPENMLLGDAMRVMVRLRRRHLAVVDGDGRCLGVLADGAVAAAWAHDPTSLSREPVRTRLPAVPAVIAPHANVLDVARMMSASGADAVAVVDNDGEPVGIVTGSDLVALLAG